MGKIDLLITKDQASIRLNDLFGHDNFIDGQWEIISEVFSKNSVLVIKQTGFGKSLCYQLPALIFDGITLVFSPLIALMRDQVNYLNKIGIPAKCINSDNSREENASICESVLRNEIKLLYVAPERQNTMLWVELISKVKLSMIVIDEAHCISVWGHDFRPSYKKIANTISKFKNIPVMALTATANHRTELDIRDQIGDFKTIRGSLFRDNLRLHVLEVSAKHTKMAYIGHLIKTIEGTGIVFTGTKADAEDISKYLSEINISNTYYHSKISNRSEVEKSVINNEYKCIVSTNAFGMGIDKPDFRFIIHTQFPGSPLHYYQEIGRAGRDGKLSDIFLLWNKGDERLHHYFINSAKPPVESYQDVISYLQENPRSKTFTIATSLDLEESKIKNIINDLEDQNIVEGEIESQNELTKFKVINRVGKLSDIQTTILNILNEPLTIFSITRKVFGNTKQHSKNIILSNMINLLDRKIVEKIEHTKVTTHYKIFDNAPVLNFEIINMIRKYKFNQLKLMLDYINTSDCRMNYLCNNLGDYLEEACTICDNCNTSFTVVDTCDNSCGKCMQCLDKEFDNYSRIRRISFTYPSERSLQLIDRKNKLLDGISCYFYKFLPEPSNDEITRIKSLVAGNNFDLIISLPENKIDFCEQMAKEFDLPHIQMFIRDNDLRVQSSNWYNRRKHAEKFTIVSSDLVENKSILLFDNTCQSGITIKEVGKYLSKLNVKLIQPVFISKL